MSNWRLVQEGKVRQVYEDAEGLKVLLVAGDGVSAFDQKLGVCINGKGKMLTRISKYWFDKTADLVPNAYSALHTDPEPVDIPEGLGIDISTVTPMLKLHMFPVEAIVRGYITGSMWDSYHKKGNREFCGHFLPADLRNSQKLDAPLFTPTTKAPVGEHDQNLSFLKMMDHLKDYGVMAAYDRSRIIREYSISLYNYAHDELLKKGIILADTKFEFGVNPLTGSIMLADELFTPDSSRFWALKDYEPGRKQKSLDKQLIRDWVKDHPDKRVPKEVLEETTITYARIADVMTSDRVWE